MDPNKRNMTGTNPLSTLVKWESILLFVNWKYWKEAKKVHLPFRRGVFVGLFFRLSSISYMVWNFHSLIKNTNRNLAGKNHLSSLALMLISQNFSLSRELLHENGKGKVHLPFRRGVFEGLFFVTIFTLRLGLGTFNRVLHPKPGPSSNWMRSSIQIKSLVDGHVKC